MMHTIHAPGLEAGGNIETTVPGEVVRTSNGVTCVGYTDLPSRCAGQASTLFGNNIDNFMLSMGDSKRGVFQNNHDDEAVRGALVTQDREVLFPPPPPPAKKEAAAAPAPPSAPVEAQQQQMVESEVEKAPAAWLPDAKKAATFACFLAALLAVGAGAPPPEAISLVSMFSLACVVGYLR